MLTDPVWQPGPVRKVVTMVTGTRSGPGPTGRIGRGPEIGSDGTPPFRPKNPAGKPPGNSGFGLNNVPGVVWNPSLPGRMGTGPARTNVENRIVKTIRGNTRGSVGIINLSPHGSQKPVAKKLSPGRITFGPSCRTKNAESILNSDWKYVKLIQYQRESPNSSQRRGRYRSC